MTSLKLILAGVAVSVRDRQVNFHWLLSFDGLNKYEDDYTDPKNLLFGNSLCFHWQVNASTHFLTEIIQRASIGTGNKTIRTFIFMFSRLEQNENSLQIRTLTKKRTSFSSARSSLDNRIRRVHFLHHANSLETF